MSEEPGMEFTDWVILFTLINLVTAFFVFSYRTYCEKKDKPPRRGESHPPLGDNETSAGGNEQMYPQGNNATQPHGGVNEQPQRNDRARQHEQQTEMNFDGSGQDGRNHPTIFVQLQCCGSQDLRQNESQGLNRGEHYIASQNQSHDQGVSSRQDQTPDQRQNETHSHGQQTEREQTSSIGMQTSPKPQPRNPTEMPYDGLKAAYLEARSYATKLEKDLKEKHKENAGRLTEAYQLRKDLNRHKEKANQLDTIIQERDDAQSKHDPLKQKVTELEEIRNELDRQLTIVTGERDANRKEATSLREIYENLTTTQKDIRDELAASRKERDNFEKEIEPLKHEIKQLETDRQSLQHQLFTASNKQEKVQKELEQKTSEFGVRQRSLEEQLSTTREERDEAQREVKQKMVQAEASQKSLEQKLSTASKERNEALEECSNWKATNFEIVARLKEREAKSTEAHKEKTSLQERVDELVKARDDALNEAKTSRDENIQGSLEIQEIRNSLTKVNQERDDFKKQADTLSAEKTKLQAQLDSAAKNDTSHAEKVDENGEPKLQHMSTANNDAAITEKLAVLTRELDDHRKQADTLREENEKLKVQHSSTANKDSELANNQSLIEKLTRELDEAKKKSENLNAIIDTATKSVVTERKSKRELEEELEKRTKERDSTAVNNKELRSELDAAKAQNEANVGNAEKEKSLQDQLERMKEDLSNTTKARDQITTERNEIDKNLQEANNRYRDDLAKAEQDNDEAYERNQELKKKYQDLKKQLIEANKKLANAPTKADQQELIAQGRQEYAERVSKQQIEYEKMKLSRLSATKEIDELKTQLKKKEEEIKKLLQHNQKQLAKPEPVASNFKVDNFKDMFSQDMFAPPPNTESDDEAPISKSKHGVMKDAQNPGSNIFGPGSTVTFGSGFGELRNPFAKPLSVLSQAQSGGLFSQGNAGTFGPLSGSSFPNIFGGLGSDARGTDVTPENSDDDGEKGQKEPRRGSVARDIKVPQGHKSRGDSKGKNRGDSKAKSYESRPTGLSRSLADSRFSGQFNLDEGSKKLLSPSFQASEASSSGPANTTTLLPGATPFQFGNSSSQMFTQTEPSTDTPEGHNTGMHSSKWAMPSDDQESTHNDDEEL
ncbi:hypothetical protein N0V90_006946 [Kalmusia sp. IMI 367209]|nr:hypothetical protein N0V90_006946 [Kalmusia sp. IMI 367209]